MNGAFDYFNDQVKTLERELGISSKKKEEPEVDM